MNWNQLKYVVTIVEEKNISKAAKKLYISQPSLSISITQLEKEIGSPLFERSKGTLQLTHIGKLFFDWAQMVLNSKEALIQRFYEFQTLTRERIRVGIGPHRSMAITPTFVKTVTTRFPMCELIIVEKPANELKELLNQDELDLIIDIPQEDQVTYISKVIVEERMKLAIPKAWKEQEPFCRNHDGKVDIKEVLEYPFILLPEAAYFGKMSRYCLQEAGIVPKIACECTFSDTAKNLVKEEVGIAFLPDFFEMQDQMQEDICFYEIANNEIKRSIAMIYKREKYRTELFTEVEKILEECISKKYCYVNNIVQ